ncbi:acetyltransferase (GNAT) family protein [Kribbella voronezhensis]|uniref:Acetyltransferase (GNAT) family protein n=1 Tax=Kribbella voronezhensis TaxID=2512212 RepID=A0A4R7T7Z9_9ACTN|nr:GNAT family N-acetyltransferase [Kribbella voronezhensis]TDU88062.1 acetyltransferase (GNAT) family protein [Kribbella voronezhensis]
MTPAREPRIRLFEGDREVLRPLFREADDSEQGIDAYLGLGDILVADDGGEVVGHLQLVGDGDEAELKSLAVAETHRGTGVGRALVAAALRRCRERGVRRITVSTASADTGNLRFYQRQGFRLLKVERDVFGPAEGYPEGIVIDGIPLRDRVWLDQDL